MHFHLSCWCFLELSSHHLDKEISVCLSLAACENEEPQQSPKAFLFPDKKKTDYIDAGTLDKDLNALTVSLWIKTDDTSKVGYISYANKDHQNAFVLYNPNNKLALISGYYHSG